MNRADPLRVLLVEDDEDDFVLTQSMLLAHAHEAPIPILTLVPDLPPALAHRPDVRVLCFPTRLSHSRTHPRLKALSGRIATE